MLIMQHIKLEWHKENRGAPDATARNRLAAAFVLPDAFFEHQPLGFPSHDLFLQQTGSTFKTRIDRIAPLPASGTIKAGGVAITDREACAEVRFTYSFGMGSPERTNIFRKTAAPLSDDHDSSYAGLLSEIAFCLDDGDYGRISWNGKHTCFDTGTWYYHKDIVNMIRLSFLPKNKNLFTERTPDKIYEQLARLD